MSILAVGTRGDVGQRTLRALTSRDAEVVAGAQPQVAFGEADTLLLSEPDSADGLVFPANVLDTARGPGVERALL